MFKRSINLRQVSFVVSLLTLSTLSISCSPGTQENKGICDNNAFVPVLPYSNAKLSEAKLNEDYQLVFAKASTIKQLWELAEQGAKTLSAQKRRILFIDEFVKQINKYKSILNSPLKSGLVKKMKNLNINKNDYKPLLQYQEYILEAVIIEGTLDGIAAIEDYTSQQDLARYLQPKISQYIEIIVSRDFSNFKDLQPKYKKIVKSNLIEQAALIADIASTTTIENHCKP